MRERARRHGRTGQRAPHSEALRGKAALHRGQKDRLAAEEMRRPRHIEQKPMWRIKRHQGREAIAPIGDALQQLCIGEEIGVENLKRRDPGPGIGQRHAFAKTEPRGFHVHGRQAQSVVVLRGQHQGRA